MWQHKPLKEIADEAREKLAKLEEDNEQGVASMRACAVPSGYAETMDCLNSPRDWDVPGMIADMAEYLRQDLEVPQGQLLAALDWMTFQLRDARALSVRVGSGVYALTKDDAKEIALQAQKLAVRLKGFKR